ncbi:hypothetical protein GCK72_016520 [Caenorhabditis remanei]|uniref:Uncharacterized protein n=1 Tax=Caenorhabditis remanei TaxID=31234 RepID=A0A6A5G5N1_CAERE|nr:hypothetical protein GCK72_016520 [Caenorhabditis remanei]KAF1749975.1 hypothetical protein GCK72_016520 [Caenorhabditis remanei]
MSAHDFQKQLRTKRVEQKYQSNFRWNPHVPIQTKYRLTHGFYQIQKDTPVKVSFYNFAFSCVRNGIVEFLKPFVNFAMIPNNPHPESIAVIFLPSINHKLFMKKMAQSKKFMKDNQFNFAQIMNKKEPKPLNDLLLQLGINSETQNVFRKAKEFNFTTFFSGPQQIRDLIEADFDTTDHRNFISQFLIDGNFCLKDGRKLVNDQLEKMSAFLSSTSNSKVFSTLFLDDYGTHKSSIDHDLSEMLTTLNHSRIFENTTLIVTSYDLSDKDVTNENDKYPLFAVRLSDKFMKTYSGKHYFMKMNFNRLLSSLHFNNMLIELINPNEKLNSTPFIVQPTWRNCVSEGISEFSCICMNMNLSSGYPEDSEKHFVSTLREKFTKEVKRHKCVKSFEIEDYNFFYDYSINTKNEIRGVELTGFVNITGLSGEKRLMLKKMFTFKRNFESFQSFDTARVIVGHEVNIGIAR